MGDIYAYNIMFNLGTGMGNVTDLKNRLYFSIVLLCVGKHLSLWPAIKTLSPRPWEIVVELEPKSVITSNINHLFRSFDFRDFLEKHFHFSIRYLMGI